MSKEVKIELLGAVKARQYMWPTSFEEATEGMGDEELVETLSEHSPFGTFLLSVKRVGADEPAPKFIIHFEARFPSERKQDVELHTQLGMKSSIDTFADRLAEPGHWSSNVAKKSKNVVTWTVTYPAHYDLPVYLAVEEQMEQVGYYGSATEGPKSRKAHLRFRLDGDDTELSQELTCRGSY